MLAQFEHMVMKRSLLLIVSNFFMHVMILLKMGGYLWFAQDIL